MKKILKQAIVNIPDTPIYDGIFSFDVIKWDTKSFQNNEVTIIYMADILAKHENAEMLEKSKMKPASYSNVYSPKDELAIFTTLFNDAIEHNKKIHIV